MMRNMFFNTTLSSIMWKTGFFLSFLCSVVSLFAQPKATYYQSADGLSRDNLKQALGQIIKDHSRRSYDQLKDDYLNIYVVRGTSQQVYDMFSNLIYDYSQTSMWNREHVVPNSWWGGVRNAAYSDLFSVIPSEMKANSSKSNYPLGEVVGNPSYDNGCIKVGSPKEGQGGYYRYVFEPNDKHKGDFARIYFYVATCYDDISWGSHSTVKSEIAKETWPTLSPWLVNLLLRWHDADPVSDDEKNINNAVEKIQGNRNPFIDYPILANHIWGQQNTIPFSLADAVLYKHIEGGTQPPITDTISPEPDDREPGWWQVRSEKELANGKCVTLGCIDLQSVSGPISGNYLSALDATFATDSVTRITQVPNDMQTFFLESSGSAWKLVDKNQNTLGASDAKKLAWGNGIDTWNISFTQEGNVVIQSTHTKYGILQFNNSFPRFLNYTSQQTPIQLFVKVEPTGVHQPVCSSRKDNNIVYDTQGRIVPNGMILLQQKSLPRGIYLLNGAKIWVR